MTNKRFKIVYCPSPNSPSDRAECFKYAADEKEAAFLFQLDPMIAAGSSIVEVKEA